MAKKKDNTLLIVAGLAGLGGLVYYFLTKDSPAGNTGIVAPGGVPGQVAINNSAPGVTGSQVQTAAHANDPQILKWASDALSPLNYKQFTTEAPTFTAAEWNGLWLLVTGDPAAGFGTGPGTMFWDKWRTDHHINDGTY